MIEFLLIATMKLGVGQYDYPWRCTHEYQTEDHCLDVDSEGIVLDCAKGTREKLNDRIQELQEQIRDEVLKEQECGSLQI